ncbi:adenylate kinase [Fuchsiella alkaliacetigena]|uniref:adenylate kinase n=1 Tax=Fuchsiella alkaliacetigena TaxID=957042 RepID=UPI00200B8A4E|nr:adenylate kinase [Fuchsiella alkaliacetigena]MCK8824367.1 adenylate kinase [Fuchsiella alkaliacetigena]
MHIILVGPPGAGKGTQAAKLVEEFEVPHIATGDIFRSAIKNKTPLGKKAKQFIDQGKLVPDEVTIGIVRERLAEDDCQKGFILDGFPRTIAQADALQDILADLDIELDAVLNIKVSEEEVVRRLSGRRVCECGASYHIEFNPPEEDNACDGCGAELYQREDDQPETIKERVAVYKEQTSPLISYYQDLNLLKEIEGEAGFEEVFNNIKQALC